MNCRNCGKKLEEGSKYCPYCGTTTKPDKGKAIASLVIGIISIFIGVAFLPLPIIGLVLGCSNKEKCPEKTAGIILNTVSLLFAVVAIVATIVLGVVFGTKIVDYAIDKGIDSIDFSDVEIQMNTDWEKYANYVDVNDVKDTTTNLMGNWKELSDKRSYLIFDEVEYIFYDDLNNLEAKYDTGTYILTDGLEELNKLDIENKAFNKLFDKLTNELQGVSFKILKISTMKSYENGVEVPNNLTEENAYSFLVITSHDDVVELIISKSDGKEEKHYYKVLGNN